MYCASIIPVYDRVNRAISLGQDRKYREKGINGGVSPGDLVLDAGSGFGNMTSILLKNLDNKVKVVMLDPIREMLLNSKEYLSLGKFQKSFMWSIRSYAF